jgi:opacity protein-like surface antigen
MQKACMIFVAFLCLVLASTAQSQGIPREANFRYSEQVSNGPAGTCGCFALQGAAGDLYWNIRQFAGGHSAGLGLTADIGVEHTGSVNDAGYGLTLTTFTAGPRLKLPGKKVKTFAQALFGLAHGSGSQFPQGNSLESSANSFALDLGAGADYSLNKRISVRILQLDYLRTALPNNSNDWQNNLRIVAGLTLYFSH